MDEVVRKAIQEVSAKAKTSVPWELDKRYDQPYHSWDGDAWQAIRASPTKTKAPSGIHSLALMSWNIDFMLPFPDSRMRKAISHLKRLVESSGDQQQTANIIYLQESVVSDLKLLASDPWIRDTFYMTDLDDAFWQSGHYGTISLVDRRLQISSCFRVHYSKTRMERDGLFVDIKLQDKTIRLCNSHLESLALDPPYRIPQIQLCAEYMRAPGIDGAAAAGDFNAIQDFDRTLHSVNALKDAYLERGGHEDDAEGHTWGQQAATKLRNQFGTSRMDKAYFCGNLAVQRFDKFGADVCVDDPSERAAIVRLGFEKPWITDHLGIRTIFGIDQDQRPSSSL